MISIHEGKPYHYEQGANPTEIVGATYDKNLNEWRLKLKDGFSVNEMGRQTVEVAMALTALPTYGGKRRRTPATVQAPLSEIWVITYNFSTINGSVSHLSANEYFRSQADAEAYLTRNHMNQGPTWPRYRAERLKEYGE